jgi:hypothetical protein
MKKDNNVEEQVDRILAGLDSLRRVDADPYFYARLKARMRSTGTGQQISTRGISLRWILGASGILLLIALNVYSVMSISPEGVNTESVKQQNILSFADEYDLRYDVY